MPMTMSPDEGARYLAERGFKVSGQTLRRWAHSRKVTHVRLPSGLVLFTAEDLDALIEPVTPERAS